MKTYPPRTERRRRRLTHHHVVRATPDDVFPLLCPVLEHEWIPTWRCRVLYSESGVAEEGCVFTTDGPAGVDTWVVTHYEAPTRIAFVRVDALRTMLYDIRLTPHGEGTSLRWSQTITGLSPEGDHHVEALDEASFRAMVDRLGPMIEHYLATGRALGGAA